MLCRTLLLLAATALVTADVSHILDTTTTEPPPPRPYLFSYAAGRYPGHVDREHSEVSDGSGTVRGTFSYVDPSQKVRTVDYIADKQGFHPILSDVPPEHPTDSESVAKAKNRHYQLYAKIAEDHATHPHPDPEHCHNVIIEPLKAIDNHYQLYSKIAEEHSIQTHMKSEASVPRQSEAVAAETAKHAQLFRVIAEQHARIAAEREALQLEEEEQQRIQELQVEELQHLHEH